MRGSRTLAPGLTTLRASVALASLVGFLSFGGCSSGGAGAPDDALGHDRTESSALAVDEARVVATVDGARLRVSVPVRSKLDRQGSGTLRVALRSVDDLREVASADVAYALAAREEGALEATLPFPSDVAAQEDLVRYNVRITDGDALGVRVRRSLLSAVPRYQIAIEGPSSVTKGQKSVFRVRADDAVTHRPVEGQKVTIDLARTGGATKSLEAITGADGTAVFEIAPDTLGAYTVTARAAAQGTQAAVAGAVTVDDPTAKVLVTTDKPLYQPGQVVHARTLSLTPRASTPIAGAPVLFEVLDGKGNKIVKRSRTSDAWGIASTDVALGAILNEGTFHLKITEGEVSTEKTFEVKPYALPKFKAQLTADRAYYLPGQTLSAVVRADYFFGKPVVGGDVRVEAATLDVAQSIFQTAQGKTDATGRFELSIKLPSTLVGLPIDHGNALVSLHTKVTDTAGQVVEQTRLVSVAESAIDTVLVPESTSVVPGIANQLDLFASDPVGAPTIGAAVAVDLPGTTLAGTTDAFGHATFTWTPDAASAGSPLTVTTRVTPTSGAAVSKTFTFGVQTGTQHLIVRTDRAVYEVGDTIHVDVLTAADASHVYVDWLNDGQAVDMRTVEVTAGKASFTMTVDDTLLGSNLIEAYTLDPSGGISRVGRTVVARKSGGLKVDMTTDRATYAPGQPAKLTFSVKDESGQPTVAALGVQIVDEAVFALVDAQPGLLRTYFELESAFAQPAYEIQGPRADLADLLFTQTAASDPQTAAAAQTRAAAALSAMGGKAPTGVAGASWPGVVTRAKTALQPFFATARLAAIEQLKLVASSVQSELFLEGCTPASYWCPNSNTSYGQEMHARIVKRAALWDFWGNAWTGDGDTWSETLRFTSEGPDETAGTSDDATMDVAFGDLGAEYAHQYPGGTDASAGGNGGASGAGGGGGAAGSGGAGGDKAGEPRVRRDFPETLYVNPALITGPDGRAEVDLTMADSITEWRVSTLANSASGRLGAGVSGVTVFQDFFVDVAFPATLTRGDVVSFPIAVYNYLPTTQNVALELTADTWYTPLGATSLSVDVQPGEVAGVRFPVRVDEVGLRTLVVKARGQAASDAVARTVRVVPDGKLVSDARSGSAAPGVLTQSVSYPAGMVPGSAHLLLSVYPAFLSQVVSGMDSMLQVPNGCFEQTTSTTWPNVLVGRYMKQTGQLTPEIEMKAESLVSAGYQRLLTFEHTGGGYSWFGEQDPAPNTSVTAFGVMEFADMAKQYTVDDAMLARTVQWLVGRQQADGSWTGEQTEFFSFQTSASRNTAFVVWALASAGYTGPELAKGLAYLEAQSGTSSDAYTLALVANAAVAVAPNGAFAAGLLADLDAAKIVEGEKVHWGAETDQTNFYATGSDAVISTTALAAHALLQGGAFGQTTAGALEYLVGSRDAMGNFGSTQATIWTLRSLLLAASKGTEAAIGTLGVEVDGAPYASLALTQDQSDVTSTVDLSTAALVGDHQVKLTFVGTGKPSYNLVTSYNVPWAGSVEPPGPLTIDVAYDRTSLAMDETVQETVTVTNTTAVTQRMVLVTLGVPPGFEVVGDDFTDDLTAGRISKWESTGRQLILYVTEVAPSSALVVAYRLRATMPVTVDDGGGEVHPYYAPSARATAPSQKLTVAAP